MFCKQLKHILKIIIALLFLSQPLCYAQSTTDTINVSDDVKLIKLSDKIYIHVSYFETQHYGKVAANGLLLVNNAEALLFDSPWDNKQTETLFKWITDSLNTKIVGFVPNHWHADCMGGLEYLNKQGVKSYANQMTIDIAKDKGLPLPAYGFENSHIIKLNDIKVECYYLGGGHSTDNIVVWIPSEKILFPACMVKDIDSENLGNLSDAALDEWLPTIEKLEVKFPDAETIVPGHGRIGGKELLIHTKKILNKHGK